MSREQPRIALPGSSKLLHMDFDSLPAISPTEEFTITIRVKRKRKLGKWTKQYLTHEQLGERHGAAAGSREKVHAFAQSQGLEVVASHGSRREVVVRGTARAMQRAFSVELRVGKVNGRECRIRRGEISIPKSMATVITSVTGLDNRPFAKPHYRVTRQKAHNAGLESTVPVEAAFTPLEIGRLYNFPEGLDGSGQTIALLELDGGFRPEEMADYFQDLNVGQPSIAVASFEGGGENNPGSNALDPFCRDAEVALDLQVAGALAPGAKMLVYFARDDSDESFLAAMSAIVHDAVRKPDIISISWGGPESMATEQFRVECDQLLQVAAHLGITVCAATGDNAAPDFSADDPRWDKCAHVDFPACDPWALACGGTHVSVDGLAIAKEEAWFEGPNDGAGGGVSRLFPLPDYQKSARVPRAANPDGPAMRGIPDVSANASPGSGFRILCNGQRFPDPSKNVPPMGGTSAVAPLWAALVARMNQAVGRRCGFLNPLLYELAAKPESAVFRNPKSGTNGVYFAGPGWNACTGLGSVDGAALLDAIRKILSP